MPVKFTALLDPLRISLALQSTQRPAALGEVAGLLRGHPNLIDFDGFFADLLERDQLDTTNLGNGISLPHARTLHVRDLALAVGRSNTGIRFDADGEPVRLVFVLATPRTKPGDYLAVVSTLCKLLRDPGDRKAALDAATPDAFITTLKAIEKRLKL